jgi:hypothetical protein
MPLLKHLIPSENNITLTAKYAIGLLRIRFNELLNRNGVLEAIW